MQKFDGDLHIHSPHSIAVSQKVTEETLHTTSQYKGLSILGTGDITQPDWRNRLKEKLDKENGMYSYKGTFFIVQTELEDNESIHHVVLLPDFRSAEVLQERLSPFVKNIEGRWAGRPHVHKSPAEIVEFIEDVGGLCGPAHAFTPFKSVFRQGKFSTLEEAYGTAYKKLAFLELGLSADTYLADRMECLQEITFLSNSDAHSESAFSLGREFNRFLIEEPSFDEIRLALLRRKGRKVTLNVGLDPQLGKYYIMFCGKCRRRIQRNLTSNKNKGYFKSYQGSENSVLDQFLQNGQKSGAFKYHTTFDDDFIYYEFPEDSDRNKFMKSVQRKEIGCIACSEAFQEQVDAGKLKKLPKIPRFKLGVSERINQISTWKEPHHPDHRPEYLDIIPLIDIIRTMKQIKSKNSKTVENLYLRAIETIGNEYDILADIDPQSYSDFENGKLSQIIEAFRNKEIEYIPGGGGTFGDISFEGT